MGNVDRPQMITSYSYFGSWQQLPYDHSFVLSEESPSYVYNVSYPGFGISSLQTNDTSVHVVVWYQDQVIFNATDIQEITDFDVKSICVSVRNSSTGY